jgi:hypothetical protein
MDKINNLFDQEITKTLDSFPSIYTKDDVVSLLSALRTEVLYKVADALSEANKNASLITEMQFQDFAEDVERNLSNYINQSSEIIDYDSAEFELDYNNKIVLNQVCVDADMVTDELHSVLLDNFQQHFGNLISKENESSNNN